VTLYKITGPEGQSIHGGTGKWPLPETGKWRSVRGSLAACERGLHLVDEAHLAQWVKLDTVVWEAEHEGDLIDAGDKSVARKARLTRKVGVLTRELLVEWACDCAERALPIFEAKHSDDDRPRKAIETTRAWLRGEASIEQVRDAAAAAYAADAAAAYAAYAAAVAAAYAAYAAAAAYAAYAADAYAYYAADAAAAYAAYARQKEKTWQSAHLLELLSR